jgi:hypothetical protein
MLRGDAPTHDRADHWCSMKFDLPAGWWPNLGLATAALAGSTLGPSSICHLWLKSSVIVGLDGVAFRPYLKAGLHRANQINPSKQTVFVPPV